MSPKFVCSAMDTNTEQRLLILTIITFMSLFFKKSLSMKTDTISVGYALAGNSTIVSAKGLFELGFFQPGPSPNHYIGIWYSFYLFLIYFSKFISQLEFSLGISKGKLY